MFLETIIGASLVVAAAQAREIPNISIPAETPGRYLVKGHALEPAPLGPIKAVPFAIDHVYVGPPGIKGQKFTASLYESEFSFNMPKGIGMPVVKGESAICWIQKGREELETLFDTTLKDGPVIGKAELDDARAAAGITDKRLVSPNFVRGDVKYEMAAARADVSEKVYRASEKDRFKVIDCFARAGDSVKAAAALHLLLGVNTRKPAEPPAKHTEIVKNPKIADYVLPLVKPGAAPPRVQGVVDQLLYLNKDGWRESPERWKMYESWFAGDWKEKKNVPWDASEERVLVERSGRPYPQPQSVQLWLAGLTNPARSARFKAEFIRHVESSRSPEDAEKGFAFLVQTIRKDAAPSKKVAAAKLLVVFAPFSAEQRATVEGLRRENLGEEVTKELKKALAQK